MEKKILLVIVALLLVRPISGQAKKFVVLDALTKLPINLVHVSYPALEVGSITNSDGIVSVPTRKSILEFSHIEYKTIRFRKEVFIKKDTIYLRQDRSELQEIVLYNIDLKDKISQALRKVKKNYGTKNIVHNGTYKETFRVNDSLSRLFQIQMQWWSKNSLFDFKKWVFNQNKVIIDQVDYSKVFTFEKTQKSGKGGFIENQYFFTYVHLNFLLSVLKNNAKDFMIQSVNKGQDQVSIVFDASYHQNGEKVFDYYDCLLVFDKEYEKVKYVKLNMDYQLKFEKDITQKDSIPYEKATKSHRIELSYSKNLKNKYTLNYFISEVVGYLKFEGQMQSKVSAEQSLFITESNVKVPFDEDKSINLIKPFYTSIPEKRKKKTAKMLLTKEEEEFLKQN